MPPKPKFSREDIILAAYEMCKEKGMDAVVARELGKKLGTTVSPIFTMFKNMDDLKGELLAYAKKEALAYFMDSLNYQPAFKAFGMRYVQYAIDEPHLYELLILKGDMEVLVNEDFEPLFEQLYLEIAKNFKLETSLAKEVLVEMVTYANGLASFILSGAMSYKTEEISCLLSEACFGFVFLKQIEHGLLDEELGRKMLAHKKKMPVKKEDMLC